jgi:hypothetical protein
VHAVSQQLHIIPAAGADNDADEIDDDSAGIAVAATVAADDACGVGAIARRWSGTTSSTANTDTSATDNIAIDESTIRAAMAKQREHNKATDATIAELRAEVAALNRKLNACLIVMIVILAVAVATVTGRAK